MIKSDSHIRHGSDHGVRSTPDAEIFHVRLINGESQITKVSSNNHKSDVCVDLGYRPSDIIQSNCIIWVEGPSDRIYVNNWLKSLGYSFIEGIHYSIMFYGGRLASHLSGEDSEELVDDFISLRKLNRRMGIIIDSDKENSRSKINDTKKRLKNEFDNGQGFSWVTSGKEIENYIDPEIIKNAISVVHPSSKPASKFEKYSRFLTLNGTRSGKPKQANKVLIATHISDNYKLDYYPYDLKRKIKDLGKFIEDSNSN